ERSLLGTAHRKFSRPVRCWDRQHAQKRVTVLGDPFSTAALLKRRTGPAFYRPWRAPQFPRGSLEGSLFRAHFRDHVNNAVPHVLELLGLSVVLGGRAGGNSLLSGWSDAALGRSWLFRAFPALR